MNITTTQRQALETRTKAVANAAGEKLHKQYPNMEFMYEIRPGKKYYKVVTGHITGLAQDAPTQWSAWCFVDATTGDVYKPASWKAPAKHVRYNLFQEDSYNKALEKADPYGSWLYIK